ncbi:endonuclease/exonuclease/phosphatase family protein [Enterococcus massiliensis]|uniref:endonuclease/exonuclease/phosphatase family protein n=1 Tax=Enterococcus massiliensis TaxID=1640685 RepID=UPI00065E0DF7|nr:endonuclease/exonuclease/phosphatase family protein [Enterococcus massiliensis]
MAKFLTLNTHSWMEEDPEEKLEQLAEQILAEQYDGICLQEVNQRIDAKEAVLDGAYCPTNSEVTIREDNFALRLVELLQIQDQEYYWTWAYSHIGYDIYQEGSAILSKEPIIANDFFVSQSRAETDYHTRKLVTGLTEIEGKMVRLVSCHYSWWQEGFAKEWRETEKALTGKELLVIMGDFNNPADSEGYHLVTESTLTLQDAFQTAQQRKGNHTIEKEIDGWQNNTEALRIDFIFLSASFEVLTYQTVFDGKQTPVVSDHYGVAVTTA